MLPLMGHKDACFRRYCLLPTPALRQLDAADDILLDMSLFILSLDADAFDAAVCRCFRRAMLMRTALC